MNDLLDFAFTCKGTVSLRNYLDLVLFVIHWGIFPTNGQGSISVLGLGHNLQDQMSWSRGFICSDVLTSLIVVALKFFLDNV